MAGPQAGWYQDPSGDVSKLRYWNGELWTDDFTDAPQSQPAQPQAAVQQTQFQQAPVQQTQFQQAPVQQAAYNDPNANQAGISPAYYQQPSQTMGNSNDQTLRLIAFILCIVSMVTIGWTLIPLAWMIPMTIYCWGIYKGTKKNTTAFGVCTLIFVNTVGGILLLVSKRDDQ